MLESFAVKGLAITALLLIVPFLLIKLVLVYLLELQRDLKRNPPS